MLYSCIRATLIQFDPFESKTKFIMSLSFKLKIPVILIVLNTSIDLIKQLNSGPCNINRCFFLIFLSSDEFEIKKERRN